MYANLIYIIMSFCYILPTSIFGWFHNAIPRAHLLRMSKKPFLVMGFLDAVSAAMQVLATIYLPGTLLVLLPQAAIPLSMLASRVILRERFTARQYVGAVVVMAGIVVVLFPVLTHQQAPEYSCQAIDETEDCTICQMETSKEECLSHVRKVQDEVDLAATFKAGFTNGSSSTDDGTLYCDWISRDESLRTDDFLVFVWSLVMIASCVPMVLSSVYKQVALQVQLDPILVNGWVAVFQFLCGIPLAIPAGLASSPKVKPWDLPSNWLGATECLFVQSNSIESGCHPDECGQAALWVHLGLLSSAAYTVSMMFVLKYGSSSLLYLGLTLMVPLGHLVFSLHSPSSIHLSDVFGLFVLMAGLVLYRFGHDDDDEVVATTSSASPAAAEGREEGNHYEDGNNAANGISSKDGFLEFLREPFMLVGDI
jgi:drug/metabolite transporter (DMT)-like permease